MLGNLGDMFQRAALPSFIVAAILMALMFASSFFCCSSAQNLTLDRETFARVMQADTRRSIVYAWPDFPVRLLVAGAPSERDLAVTREIVEEINTIANRPVVVLMAEGADPDAAEIHIVFSPKNQTLFEAHYAALFKRRFGAAQFSKWDAIGGFEFPYSDLHPCFGFFLFDPDDVDDPEFAGRHSPPSGMIAMGQVSIYSNIFMKACLREEISHLVFFIPDFVVASDAESIFNSNAVADERQDFSPLDRELMAFLASNLEPGLSFDDLAERLVR